MISTPTRNFAIAFLTLAVAACLPPAANGQCPPPPATSSLAEGEIGLFFDPYGTTTCAVIPIGVQTPLYVVARVPEGGVAEFQVPDLLAAVLPPGMMVFPSDSPAGGLYVPLISIDSCDGARRADPLTCPVAQGDLLVIAVPRVMLLAPFTGVVCFQTACPTFIGITPTAPAYERCDTGVRGAFFGGDAMCFGFGQAPLPAEEVTWGAVKSIYR